jgi:hypothetical protein
MTVKQKAARAKFTKAISEAKKLRAKNPKLTQAEAVKQAFAILYGKQKPKKVGAVNKKAAPKKKAALKKAAPKKKAAVKKAAPKKKAAVKKGNSVHKDTKSHNVNIRVMSGMGNIGYEMVNELKLAHDKLIKWQKVLSALDIEKTKVSKGMKQVVAMDIKKVKDAIKEQKIHIQQLKKNIK